MKIRDQLRSGRRLGAFAAYSSLALLSYELQLRSPLKPYLPTYRKRMCKDIVRMLGVDTYFDGPAGPSSAALIVGNHRTAIDVALLAGHFDAALLSRGDLESWPIVGKIATHGDTVFVDRADSSSGARAIRLIRKTLKSGKRIVVFPEGTTHVGDEVREFSAGAFLGLGKAEIPIIPVGLAYDPGMEWVVGTSFTSHLNALASRPKSHVAIKVGKAELLKGNARTIAKLAQERVQELTFEARKLHSLRWG